MLEIVYGGCDFLPTSRAREGNRTADSSLESRVSEVVSCQRPIDFTPLPVSARYSTVMLAHFLRMGTVRDSIGSLIGQCGRGRQ